MNFRMMLFHRNTARRLARGAYAGLLAFAMIAASEAGAQSAVKGVPNAMQGFSQNRDQPIQIEAASLEMRDKKKEATFAGNVKVVQGDTTMTSKSLVVFYDQSAAPAPAPAAPKAAKTGPIQSATPGPGGSSSIRRLEAKGSVVVTQKDQVVTGETAIFDTRANLITMVGGVVLTQCKNVLKGDRLTEVGASVQIPAGAKSDAAVRGAEDVARAAWAFLDSVQRIVQAADRGARIAALSMCNDGPARRHTVHAHLGERCSQEFGAE